MKKTVFRLVVLMVSMLFISGSARAAELIINNWNTGYSFVEIDSKDREVSSIDDPASFPMYNLMKTQTKYVGSMPTLVDGALYMGTAKGDLAAYNHSVSLEYRWDNAMDNIAVEFDYTARTNSAAGTYLRVCVGYHPDMYATGYTNWVYEVYRTTNSGHHVISVEEINSIVEGKANVVYIQECKIGTGNGGVLDNIIITGGDTGVVETPVDEPVVDHVVVQKAGYYTAELVTGDSITGDIYINDELVSTFYTGLASIGMLEVGDTIRIVANNMDVERIEEVDYQSWNFFYAGDEIQIYVEDPPVPTCEPVVEYVEVEVIVEKPVEVIKYVEVPVEKIVEIPVEIIVEVPCECQCNDGNNGHGNDEDGYDESNPGKKNKKRCSDR